MEKLQNLLANIKCNIYLTHFIKDIWAYAQLQAKAVVTLKAHINCRDHKHYPYGLSS